VRRTIFARAVIDDNQRLFRQAQACRTVVTVLGCGFGRRRAAKVVTSMRLVEVDNRGAVRVTDRWRDAAASKFRNRTCCLVGTDFSSPAIPLVECRSRRTTVAAGAVV